jgi:hypothetical protein
LTFSRSDKFYVKQREEDFGEFNLRLSRCFVSNDRTVICRYVHLKVFDSRNLSRDLVLVILMRGIFKLMNLSGMSGVRRIFEVFDYSSELWRLV